MDLSYILLITILFSLTLWGSKNNDLKAFKIASIVVFVFVAFRAPVVGADTWHYYQFFTGMRNYYNEDQRELETGFLIYNTILQVVFLKQGLLYMIANTIVSMGMIYVIIRDYSSFKTLSVLLFFLILPYGVYFVALRQILGTGILLFGFWYLLKGKKKKWIVYIATSVIGWGFHTLTIVEAAVFLFFYFSPLKGKIIATVLVMITALGGLILKKFDMIEAMNTFLSLGISVTDRLNQYMENIDGNLKEESESLFIALRYSLVALFSIWLMPQEKIRHPFTGIFVAGICIYNLFFDLFLILRLIIPFWLFGIIVFTWIFDYRHKIVLRIVTWIIVVYFLQAYIKINTYYEKDDRLHPYLFFFEDYRYHAGAK